MINLVGYFMGKLGDLALDIWSTFKMAIYLLVFIALLMVGMITRNIPTIVVSGVLIITAMGAMESDRGIKDATYIIKGKKVFAKKFLKVKPEKEGFGLWGVVGSLLILLIVSIVALGLACIPILIITVIIRLFVNSWFWSIMAAIFLIILGATAIYFKMR